MDNVNIKKNKALPFLALLLVVAGLTMGSICSFAVPVYCHTHETVNDRLYTIPEHYDVNGVLNEDGNRIYYKIYINGFESVTFDNATYYFYLYYSFSGSVNGEHTSFYIVMSSQVITDDNNDIERTVAFISKVTQSRAWALSTNEQSLAIASQLNIGRDVDDNNFINTNITICFNDNGGEEMTETGIVTQVLGVFSAIGEWFADTIPNMLAVFYNSESGLTILGTLAVCSLAIAVILLVLAWILDFFKFRR